MVNTINFFINSKWIDWHWISQQYIFGFSYHFWCKKWPLIHQIVTLKSLILITVQSENDQCMCIRCTWLASQLITHHDLQYLKNKSKYSIYVRKINNRKSVILTTIPIYVHRTLINVKVLYGTSTLLNTT